MTKYTDNSSKLSESFNQTCREFENFVDDIAEIKIKLLGVLFGFNDKTKDWKDIIDEVERISSTVAVANHRYEAVNVEAESYKAFVTEAAQNRDLLSKALFNTFDKDHPPLWNEIIHEVRHRITMLAITKDRADNLAADVIKLQDNLAKEQADKAKILAELDTIKKAVCYEELGSVKEKISGLFGSKEHLDWNTIIYRINEIQVKQKMKLKELELKCIDLEDFSQICSKERIDNEKLIEELKIKLQDAISERDLLSADVALLKKTVTYEEFGLIRERISHLLGSEGLLLLDWNTIYTEIDKLTAQIEEFEELKSELTQYNNELTQYNNELTQYNNELTQKVAKLEVEKGYIQGIGPVRPCNNCGALVTGKKPYCGYCSSKAFGEKTQLL